MLVAAAGFSSKMRQPAPLIRLEGVVLRHLREIADVVDREHGRVLAAAEVAELREIRREQVVARNDDEIVVDFLLLEHERDVADRPELVVVARRPVVNDGHVIPAGRPRTEVGRELRIGDDVRSIGADPRERPQHVIEHRPPPTGSSAFG